MKKICKNCGNEKDITSFHKKKASPDGLQAVCKICTTIMFNYYKEKRKIENPPVKIKKTKSDPKQLSLVGTTKRDYCSMYSAMDNLGYNPEMDIHIQFCKKWGLKVSKSPRKGPKNQYSIEDCK